MGLQVEGWALPDHELRSTLTPHERVLSRLLVTFGTLLPLMFNPDCRYLCSSCGGGGLLITKVLFDLSLRPLDVLGAHGLGLRSLGLPPEQPLRDRLSLQGLLILNVLLVAVVKDDLFIAV